MRRILMAACLVGLVFVLPFRAQAAQIAVIDLQEVLQDSNPGNKAMQQLQDYQKDMRSELEQKKKSLDRLKQELQQQSMMLSEEAKKNKQTRFQKQAQQFQSTYQKYQQRMQKREQELREPIVDVLMDVIEEYGENNDYQIIMDKRNSGVMYHKESLEITDTIIKKLNQAWKERDKEIPSE